MPIIKSIVGEKTAKRISDSFDKLIHVNKFAFKFVPIGIVAPNIVETPNPYFPIGACNDGVLVF